MSLLGDLQEQVRTIRAQEAAQDAQREAQAAFYQQQLRPVMQRAYAYFAEIVEHLNVVTPDISARYPLNPQQESGVELRQAQYKFRADNRETPHQIDIFCRCALHKPGEFYLSSPRAIEQHAELLDSYNFAYHRKNRLDRHHQIRGATFVLEGPMMVHIRIAASPAEHCVQVSLRNLEDQPLKRYRFAPEAVTDDLFERIARVLLRQSPRLVEQSVDPGVRNQLQRQIASKRAATARDIAQAHADRQAMPNSPQGATVLRRTRQQLTARARELLALVTGK